MSTEKAEVAAETQEAKKEGSGLGKTIGMGFGMFLLVVAAQFVTSIVGCIAMPGLMPGCAKVLLLCLSAGLTVPPHSHPGFDITLQPLTGKAILPIDGEKEITVKPGEIHFVDGSISFNPRNPFDEDFEMLIHLIKR